MHFNLYCNSFCQTQCQLDIGGGGRMGKYEDYRNHFLSLVSSKIMYFLNRFPSYQSNQSKMITKL